MGKQIIISISREYGSCGHEIAKLVAKELGIHLYDRNLLDAVAKEKDISAEELRKYDEKPKNPFISRSVKGHSNSMEDILAEMQFEYLQKKAATGESFIIVGRCAETALKEYPDMVKIFVMGDKEHKLEHLMQKYNLSPAEAEAKMNRHDSKRKAYHNRYSDSKWGDSRGYDLCVNSSKFGIERTVQMILDCIEG